MQSGQSGGGAAGEPMFGPKPLMNRFGRVPLLAVPRLIAAQPGVDDLGEPIQLRALDRRLAPVAQAAPKSSASS